MATFATRVRELRKRKRLTQNQLANELGVSMQTISLWERGPRKPDFEMLDKLTEYFEVRMEYLLGSSDDDTPHKQPTEEEIDRSATEDDDAELKLLATRLCQLSYDMRSIVKAVISRTYQIDKSNGALIPKEKHRVSIISTALLDDEAEVDSNKP